MKTEISCVSCNADFKIKHDMGDGYTPMFCCFCGEEIPDEDYLNDEYSEEDEEYDYEE